MCWYGSSSMMLTMHRLPNNGRRPAAVAALAERSYVSVTVLLELECVMRGFYELPTGDISRVLRALASIGHLTLEDRDAVLVAVDAFDKGLDFADALLVARSSRASGFATFDQRMAKRAKALALPPPMALLVCSDFGAVGGRGVEVAWPEG
jgi:predicted nucleic-acid-binding protein